MNGSYYVKLLVTMLSAYHIQIRILIPAVIGSWRGWSYLEIIRLSFLWMPAGVALTSAGRPILTGGWSTLLGVILTTYALMVGCASKGDIPAVLLGIVVDAGVWIGLLMWRPFVVGSTFTVLQYGRLMGASLIAAVVVLLSAFIRYDASTEEQVGCSLALLVLVLSTLTLRQTSSSTQGRVYVLYFLLFGFYGFVMSRAVIAVSIGGMIISFSLLAFLSRSDATRSGDTWEAVTYAFLAYDSAKRRFRPRAEFWRLAVGILALLTMVPTWTEIGYDLFNFKDRQIPQSIFNATNEVQLFIDNFTDCSNTDLDIQVASLLQGSVTSVLTNPLLTAWADGIKTNHIPVEDVAWVVASLAQLLSAAIASAPRNYGNAMSIMDIAISSFTLGLGWTGKPTVPFAFMLSEIGTFERQYNEEWSILRGVLIARLIASVILAYSSSWSGQKRTRDEVFAITFPSIIFSVVSATALIVSHVYEIDDGSVKVGLGTGLAYPPETEWLEVLGPVPKCFGVSNVSCAAFCYPGAFWAPAQLAIDNITSRITYISGWAPIPVVLDEPFESLALVPLVWGIAVVLMVLASVYTIGTGSSPRLIYILMSIGSGLGLTAIARYSGFLALGADNVWLSVESVFQTPVGLSIGVAFAVMAMISGEVVPDKMTTIIENPEPDVMRPGVVHFDEIEIPDSQ